MKSSKITNIAIDTSPTQNANSQRGVGFYTSRLLKALKQEVLINKTYQNWNIESIISTDQDMSRFHLVHYPYFDPFELTLPSTSSIPVVVTVHDLIPRQYKNYFPVGIRGEIKWLIQKNRLWHVNHIITDSEHSKTIITKLTNINPSRITKIFLASDSIYSPIKAKLLLSSISKKYNLPPKFVLYVGDINWNKNIPTLVKCCLDLHYPLVIIGSSAVQKNIPQHPWTKDLLWLQSQKSDLLHLLGFVPDQDLAVIFNLATIYCQLSYEEGFGLVLLESMQSGCPTIFSQNTSLEEISHDSGIPVNPYQINDIKQAVCALWSNKITQTHYRQLGIKRSHDFSWQKTAQLTLSVYQKLLS